MWTDHRVDAWRGRAERFSAAVWTARHLAAFLDLVAGDRLYAMWLLIALRGLRRGKAAGLRWVDLDLDHKVPMIGQQRIAFGHTVAVGPPKTAASRRTVALDRFTVKVLRVPPRAHRAATLLHLAGEPPPVLPQELLGLARNATIAWSTLAGRSWPAHAADRVREANVPMCRSR